MAIAYDSSSSGSASSAGSVTVSHTCSGSDRLLIACISSVVPGDTVTSVTYNGVSMTLVDKVPTQSNVETYMYYLLGPATGTNDIVVTSSATPLILLCAAASYTGVLQSGFPDAQSSDIGAGASMTGTVTTVATGCWMVMSAYGNSAGLSAGSGATQRAVTTRQGVFDSNGTVSVGSNSMTVNCNSDAYGYILASFAPSVTVDTDQGAYQRRLQPNMNAYARKIELLPY